MAFTFFFYFCRHVFFAVKTMRLHFLLAVAATAASVAVASSRDNRVRADDDDDGSFVSAAVLTNSNVNLGNLDSLQGDGGGSDGGGFASGDGRGPKLVGPNVCTKQEP